MRILFVADAASVHTQRWATGFCQQGDEVHVASFRPAQIPGVAVHPLPTFGLGKLGYLLAVPVLQRLASRLQPDVVHAQYLTSYGFVAAAARLRPLVVTAWGSDVLVSPQASVLARWLVGVALRKADVVTTVAAHMKAALVDLGAPSSRVVVVHSGVDVALFAPPAFARAAVPPVHIISTRNFEPVYSVHTLIEAAKTLAANGQRLQLDLVGAGPLRAGLQAQAQAAGLQPVTHFHGHVSHPTLAALLGQAHVFVSTAVSDGNSVSLYEALACGCFPVATDISANREWIEHGHNGLLFPCGDSAALADCIERAAADAALRESAARINRAAIEQRANWQHSLRHMREIYDRALLMHRAP